MIFSPDGRYLILAPFGREIKFVDLVAKKEVLRLPGTSPVQFSPDGSLLISGGRIRGTIVLRRAADLEELDTLWGHMDDVLCFSFSPDGNLLASGSLDGTVKIWDLISRKPLVTLRGHKRPVFAVAFRPDGQILASGAPDGTIRLWDVENIKKFRNTNTM